MEKDKNDSLDYLLRKGYILEEDCTDLKTQFEKELEDKIKRIDSKMDALKKRLNSLEIEISSFN